MKYFNINNILAHKHKFYWWMVGEEQKKWSHNGVDQGI